MKPAVQIERLSKRYRLGARPAGGYRTLRESIMSGLRPRRLHSADPQDFWALKEVSLDIRPGEVIGLIGRNGAGKSTLLKVLSRITEPTEGRAVVRGRMGSLLEVGTGFHPELSGRENVYLNGSILGMSRREIARKFDEIVAFSEIEKFLDTPVKRYSSGMFVRLAFAVAAHLDLDTLIVDEVLAVGDTEFQKKCLSKMGSITHDGRTVIFVSHNLGQIHRLCTRAVFLDQGKVRQDGPVADVIASYLRAHEASPGRWVRPADEPVKADACLRSIMVTGASGPQGAVSSETPLRIVVETEVLRPLPQIQVSITLRNADGVHVLTSLDADTAEWPDRVRPAGTYHSTCTIPARLLAPGGYHLSAAAFVVGQQVFDYMTNGLAIEVTELGSVRSRRNDNRGGVVMPALDWTIDRTEGDGRP